MHFWLLAEIARITFAFISVYNKYYRRFNCKYFPNIKGTGEKVTVIYDDIKLLQNIIRVY